MEIKEKKYFYILLIFLLYFIPSSFLIFSGYGKGSNYADQMEFHLPTINKYSQDWPNLDLQSHGAASTPGYHIFLSLISRYLGANTTVLQFVGVFITIGIFITLFIGLDKLVSSSLAFVLTLPLICNIYIFQAGVWIMNDNPAIWCLLGMLLIALRPQVDKWTYILGGLILFILVNIRQIHLWSASLLWVAALLGPEKKQTSRNNIKHFLKSNQNYLWRRLFFSALATLPAFLAICYYIWIWSGLNPPKFKNLFSISPISPSFFFTLFFIYGIFFFSYFIMELFYAIRTKYKPLLIVLGLGFLISAIPVSNYSVSAHRYGGLWNFVPSFPIIGERSLIFIGCGSLGIVLFYIICESFKRYGLLREGFILGFTVIAFLISHLVIFPFQRYYEPFILILLSFLAAYLSKHSLLIKVSKKSNESRMRDWIRKGKYVGPVFLAVFLVMLTFMTLN